MTEVCEKVMRDPREVCKGSGGSRISRRGGRGPRTGGPWTPEAATFQKFCMSKRKNLGPVGGARAGRAPP